MIIKQSNTAKGRGCVVNRYISCDASDIKMQNSKNLVSSDRTLVSIFDNRLMLSYFYQITSLVKQIDVAGDKCCDAIEKKDVELQMEMIQEIDNLLFQLSKIPVPMLMGFSIQITESVFQMLYSGGFISEEAFEKCIGELS